MKKGTLIILWIAVSLMFFGGILAVSTYAISGGNIGVYYQNGSFNSIKKDYSSTNGSSKEQTVKFSDIHSININSDLGEIKLVPGETGGKFIVSYNYPLNQSTVNCIDDNGTINFTGKYINYNGINFNLFGFSPKEDNYSVTITYPKGTVLKTVNIYSGLGSINLERVEADKISVKTDLGQVSCDSIKTNVFTSEASLGETQIINSQLGKTEIDSSLGEVVVNSVTTSSLDISSEAGNVEVTGALSGKTEIENALGSISVESTLPRTSYNLDLEVELGNIELDGEHEGNHIKENINAANTIQLQSEAGSISLDFIAA